MIKNILKRIPIFILMLCIIQSGTLCFAEEKTDTLDLKIYSSQKKVKPNNEKEIKNTLKKLDKYVEDRNEEGISSIISDTFISNDGFSKEAYMKMLKKSWDLYPNLKSSSKIEKLTIDGDTAQIYVTDSAKGKLSNTNNKLEKSGTVTIQTESIMFMQKYGNEWTLQSIYTLKENSILAYSDAQLIKINLTAPNQVAKDSSYCAKLQIDLPSNYIPFASITNDKIEYPPTIPEMVFKSPASDGILERIVNANSEGKNEYAVATIGITKPTISKDNKITIKISGMAVAITRVNVISTKQDADKI